MKYYILMCLIYVGHIVFAQQVKYENNNGIYFEICSDSTSFSQYTVDNEIYQVYNKYRFNYQYFTKDGKKLYYQQIYKPRNIITEDGKEINGRFISSEWEFVSQENLSDNVVIAFQIEVIHDVCNERQSCIEIRYITDNEEYVPMWETTGLVENEKNIWLHPPRQSFFRILELNPFPFIQKPYEKGNQWNWSLKIGGQWSDYRWKEWSGNIENQYVYEIVDTNSTIPTPLGELQCYKIDSYAESELGKTYLTAYFNDIYGFVRLEYINIDGSRINIDLYNAEIK